MKTRLLVLFAIACSATTTNMFADIQPFRPNWNALEGAPSGGNEWLTIAAGLLLSLAVLLTVVILRKARSRKTAAENLRPAASNLSAGSLGNEARD